MFLALCTSSNHRKPPIRPESRFVAIPHLHSTPPLGGFSSEYRHPVWYRKTTMVWLPEGEKIRRYVYSFWHDPRTWQTDRQTNGQMDGHRMTAIAVLMHSIARQKWALLYTDKTFVTYLAKYCKSDPANFPVITFGCFLLYLLPFFQLFGVRKRDAIDSLQSLCVGLPFPVRWRILVATINSQHCKAQHSTVSSISA